ncbi:hypothetical protein LTR78_005481 [Recurvomyces mirabilis]|uniref:F-box domain-containing protein n=1 Tax=Recurvomyces mirabilis TaxID=574656 RepID=A0AAE1C1N7_9PEZI|nr:hypothetical protein LTR78_005481 [Recurvomyces mirabilis]KAK5152610.1 hypothetical protein LTS14_008144 [Recurvomyces mirabilis]
MRKNDDQLPLVPPTSPSKRNAKAAGPQAKRRVPHGRVAALGNSSSNSNSGDRKDTPAPPSTTRVNPPSVVEVPFPTNSGEHARVAATDSRSMTTQLPIGGESARAAAAAYRQQPQAHVEAEEEEAMITSEEEEQDEAQELAQEQALEARREQVGSLSSAADSGADLSRPEDQSCKYLAGERGDVEMADVDGKDNEEDEEKEPEPVRVDFVRNALPAELCIEIFEYLDAQDLYSAEQVNPAWEEYCSGMSVWRHAYMRDFERKIYTNPAPILVGGAGVGRPNETNQEWRNMYNARTELDKNWRRGAEKAGKAVYLSGHTDSVYCLQFDEDKIITGSRDRTIRVWDIDTYQCIRVIGGPNSRPQPGPKVLRTVDYPHFHLATASVNSTAYGNNIYHTPSEWHDASILCLQYDDEILVTGSSDSDLLVWDIHTFEPIKRLKRHTGGVLDVALDAKHIVSCSKDSRIIIWNRQTLEYIGELSGHRGPVNAVQLRGNLLVSASGDGIARMWDIEQMKFVGQFEAKERGLAAVEFSEDMKHVLAGGNDHITYKFDVETKMETQRFAGHTQLVRSLWLDSANNRVVSGSYDLDLRVYDFVDGTEIWRAEEWTTSWMLAAKSDYRRIVATSQDGRILVVDFGLRKGGFEDGQKIEHIDLLRSKPSKNEIIFRKINCVKAGETTKAAASTQPAEKHVRLSLGGQTLNGTALLGK